MIRALALTLMLGLGGCASLTWLDRSIPQGPLDRVENPRTEIDRVPVYGHPVFVNNRLGGQVRGELLAVESRFLSVQPVGGSLVHLSLAETESVRLVVRPRPAGDVVAWGIAGTVSTLSQGFFLVLTAPTWVVITASLAAYRVGGGAVTVQPPDFDKLYQFSRFPAGLPFAFRATIPAWLREDQVEVPTP